MPVSVIDEFNKILDELNVLADALGNRELHPDGDYNCTMLTRKIDQLIGIRDQIAKVK